CRTVMLAMATSGAINDCTLANAARTVHDVVPTSMRVTLLFVAVVSLALSSSCEEKQTGPAPSRFDSVKRTQASTAANNFCEKQWPATEHAQKFVEIPERAIPGAPASSPAKAGAWTWVNLW